MKAIEILLSIVIGGYLILKWLLARLFFICALPVIVVLYFVVLLKYALVNPIHSTDSFFIIEAWRRVYTHVEKNIAIYIGIGVIIIISAATFFYHPPQNI